MRAHDVGWDLPQLKEVCKVPGIKSIENDGDLYSVKFYPYLPAGESPVFAAVGGKFILIGRLRASGDVESEVIEWLQFLMNEGEDDVEDDHYTCTWSKDVETGTPWLCVGGKYGKIQIVDALTGKLVQTLIGHGGAIEDLATSPINPQIIASASEDSSVRLWSLDPSHRKQPCAAILAGEGHRSEVLTIAFHSSGRYIVSGGIDRNINLWTIPVLPDSNTGSNNPTLIHYPHFSTSDISWHHIDCVAFHGDLIFCKSDDSSEITLFAITGFSSSQAPPQPSSAPTAHDTTKTTRSAFVKVPVPMKATTSNKDQQQDTNPPQLYTRLLTFHIPDSEVMFTRFAISPVTPASPSAILAYCNSTSKVYFWDLDRLTAYYDWSNSSPWELYPGLADTKPNTESPRPRFLAPFQRRVRGGGAVGSSLLRRVQRERERSPTTDSVISHSSTNSGSHLSAAHHATSDVVSTSSHSNLNANSQRDPLTGKDKVDWSKTRALWDEKYEMRDAFRPIEAHKEEVVKAWAFTGRQVGWSRDAEWCIVVGSGGVLALFQRKIAARSGTGGGEHVDEGNP